MKSIYLAGPSLHKEKLKKIVERNNLNCFPWWDSFQDYERPETWENHAHRDIEAVSNSDYFIAIWDPKNPSYGTLFEIGLRAGNARRPSLVIVLGTREDLNAPESFFLHSRTIFDRGFVGSWDAVELAVRIYTL